MFQNLAFFMATLTLTSGTAFAGAEIPGTAACRFGVAQDRDLQGVPRSSYAVKVSRFAEDPEQILLRFGLQKPLRDRALEVCIQTLADHSCRAEYTPGIPAVRDERGTVTPAQKSSFYSLYQRQKKTPVHFFDSETDCEITRMLRAAKAMESLHEHAVAKQDYEDTRARELSNGGFISRLPH